MSEIKDTGFIESFGELLKAKCHQDEPPFCTVACPFHLDIRDIERKWEGGRWNAAYRSFQTAVLFPEIVTALCPGYCEDVCILKERGGALAVRGLERAAVRLASRKTPSAFNLPPKGRKVVIIGGGLSGLGCALRLLNKKYEVEICEKSDVVGGEAREQMDTALFDGEIRFQFQNERPLFRLNTEVTDLEAVRKDADAVYIATGRGGNDFGTGRGSGAFATDIPGVFIGGGVTGSDLIPALADGIKAAAALEHYLKTGLMNEPADTMDTKLVMDPRLIPESVPVKPENSAQGFSAEEAAREAGRCLRCSCDICMRECDLMRIQQKTPGRLYEESYITVRPGTLVRDGRWATRRIASCDQCGLCKTVCPQRIDMGEFLLKCHRGLKDSDAMPWVFHDYWLRDMAFSADEAALHRKPAGAETCRYAFFPGCNMAASDPQYAEDSFSWLLSVQPDTAIWLNCCGAPAVWAAEDEMHARHLDDLRAQWQDLGRPEVVFACPSCMKMFRKYLPEIKGVFIEELMAERGLPDRGTDQNIGGMAVFDPCASREFPELQKAVRSLASQLGVPYEDLSHTGDLARCCSYGGQYSLAAPDYAQRVRMERAEESPLPYLTYCTNCRDTFSSRGKPALHILDLIFGRTDLHRPNPTVSERRTNRIRLKNELLEKYWGEKMEMVQPETKLLIDDELAKKLSDQYILVSEMEEVVAYCERELSGAEDPVSGHITGHLKIGHMTYWAEYEPLPDGSFRLWNGYAHRMNLEGE